MQMTEKENSSGVTKPKCRCTARCLRDDVCSSRSSIFTGTNWQRAADKFDHMLFLVSVMKDYAEKWRRRYKNTFIIHVSLI